MNKALFRSQIYFFDFGRNHNPSLTLHGFIVRKTWESNHKLFLNFLSYRYSYICDIIFGTFSLDHNFSPIIILKDIGRNKKLVCLIQKNS